MTLRCGWVNLKNPLYIDYHDHEWGKSLHDERALFELLCLEWAQAGLSWETILNRREAYREMFWNFDIEKILASTDEELLTRMMNYNVIKNKLKIVWVRKNALAYKKIIAEYGSFSEYIWSFTDATLMSQSLKKYGFTFIWPTICYAFMQASGIVNDHEKNCTFRG